MKKIGLIGGMGAASTVDYYLGLTKRCGMDFSADSYPEIVIDSLNLHDFIGDFSNGDYEAVVERLLKSICCLKAAGADFAAITSNTAHIVWDKMCGKFELPVISGVETAADYACKNNFKRVLVFGTAFTMRSGLFDRSLAARGITAVVPTESDIERVNALIYPNLENGIVIPEDKEKMLALAEQYIHEYNADSFLLGCTEIPLMVKSGDVSVPILNTVDIHIDEIYRYWKE